MLRLDNRIRMDILGSNEPKFFSNWHLRSNATQVRCSLAANVVKFANTHSPVLPNVVTIDSFL